MYTSFTRERGDEEAARLTARFAELTREVVGAGGGRTIELRGDEALCVFDSPRQALRASVALQQRFADAIREDPSLPLRVGIGLEAGEAVEAEDGFRGGALNLAARLCSLARAGDVLAGDGIVLMAGPAEGISYSDRGRVRVKGINNPVRVHRLEFELDLPAEPLPRKASSRKIVIVGAAVALVLVGAGVAAFFALGGSSEPSGVAGDSAALLDPESGRVQSETAVGATPIDVVSDASAAWTVDADAQTISRVSPEGGRALTKAAGFTPAALALGGDALWASYVERGPSGTRVGLAALDPSTLTSRSQRLLPGTGPDFGENPPILYADAAVWVGGPDDQLRKVDPVSERIRTVRLGDAAGSLAFGLGSIWATTGRRVLRVDPDTLEVKQRIPLATLVARSKPHRSSRVWRHSQRERATPPSTAEAGTPTSWSWPTSRSSASTGRSRSRWCRRSSSCCASAASGPGAYNVALQSCDDATVPAASFSGEKCAANAKRYAATASVIAVIGPYNSGCAAAEIPIANRAKPGPLPIISPTNSYVGLTRKGPGVLPGDPERFYPTGVRNFARVYPPDDMQGAADAVLAKRLGVRHPYVYLDDPNDGYSGTLAPAFATAAKRLGLDVIGPESPRPRDGFEALARQLHKEKVDGVFVGGLDNERTFQFIRAMRRGLGPRAVLIAPDAFLPAAEQEAVVGPEAVGMYVSGGVVTRPDDQLPPAGRRFAAEFRATQRGRPIDFYAPYAAQATEVLLNAIAHSDGSRASVARELLRVRLSDGIFGPFAFDRNGDPTENLLPIFRVTKNAPEALYPDDRVVTVIRTPARLVH